MSGRNRPNAHRQRLAYEAARIMMEQGAQEFDRARRKAAERAGIGNKRYWPSNEEIQEALLRHRRLFQGERQEQELRKLRKQALAAMQTFATFTPRLVGSALAGCADVAQGVRLHLFTDNPEDVVLRLLDQGIPWHEREGILRYGGGTRRAHPIFSFIAGETPFDLVVLPIGSRRNPPLSQIGERPDRGVGIAEITRLLEQPSA
jgi:hypothetical protein